MSPDATRGRIDAQSVDGRVLFIAQVEPSRSLPAEEQLVAARGVGIAARASRRRRWRARPAHRRRGEAAVRSRPAPRLRDRRPQAPSNPAGARKRPRVRGVIAAADRSTMAPGVVLASRDPRLVDADAIFCGPCRPSTHVHLRCSWSVVSTRSPGGPGDALSDPVHAVGRAADEDEFRWSCS